MKINEETTHIIYLSGCNDRFETAARVENGVVTAARIGYHGDEYFRGGSGIHFVTIQDLDNAIELLRDMRKALENYEWLK